MAWTKSDIPELKHRREDLMGMIAHHEAGHPVTVRAYGEIVNDPEADLAGLKAKLAEVDDILNALGARHDA